MRVAAMNDAAALWGATVSRLIAARENHVYEISFPNGTKAALRLHRPGYQTQSAIEDEIRWTETLASRGFPCPRPIANVDGDKIISTPDGLVTCISWVDAPSLADRISAGGDLASDFRRVGTLLADLHRESDAARLTLDRHAWDLDGLTGSDPLWGRYWENPAASAEEQAELLEIRDHARKWLQTLDTPDMGLIHADAISENIMIDDKHIWLIDFDDSGTGYRLYDLGVALVPFHKNDNFDILTRQICDGYASQREMDSAILYEMVPKFMALRALASAGWIIARAEPDDPAHRRYLDRALFCARKFLT